jgi:hypothetical protein
VRSVAVAALDLKERFPLNVASVWDAEARRRSASLKKGVGRGLNRAPSNSADAPIDYDFRCGQTGSASLLRASGRSSENRVTRSGIAAKKGRSTSFRQSLVRRCSDPVGPRPASLLRLSQPNFSYRHSGKAGVGQTVQR